MVNEAGTEAVTIDPVALDDVVISVDPVELGPIAIAEPVPADVAPVDSGPIDGATDLPPPDAQTFGGPVEIAVIDPASSGDPVPAATSVTDSGTPDSGTPDSGTPDFGTSDVPPGAESFGGPAYVVTTDPVMLVDDVVSAPASDATDVPTDGGKDASGGETPVDDGTKADTGTDGTGTDSTGTDTPFTYEDFIAIYGKDALPVSDDGTPPVVYTMSGGDSPDLGPIAYSTADTPSRSSHDPLPYERTNTASHDAPSGAQPASAPAIDPDIAALHYAAADTSHTGLDLL